MCLKLVGLICPSCSSGYPIHLLSADRLSISYRGHPSWPTEPLSRSIQIVSCLQSSSCLFTGTLTQTLLQLAQTRAQLHPHQQRLRPPDQLVHFFSHSHPQSDFHEVGMLGGVRTGLPSFTLCCFSSSAQRKSSVHHRVFFFNRPAIDSEKRMVVRSQSTALHWVKRDRVWRGRGTKMCQHIISPEQQVGPTRAVPDHQACGKLGTGTG